MRLASLTAAAAVFVLTSAPAGPVGAVEEPGAGLASYRLLANAPGIALEGLYRDVALTVPEVTSSLSTGGVGTGLAAIAWPGPVIGNGGTTLLVLVPQAPPEVSVLNDPVRAESHSGGTESATTEVPGTAMTSTATRSAVTAASSTGSGATLPVGALDVLTSSTSAEVTGPTGATTVARSTVEGLSLADGVVQVGAVTSTATVTSDGVRATAKGGTVVSGLTVGGVPVTVDGAGLHVAGQDVDNPVAQETLDALVGALGLTALLTTPRVEVSGGAARYDAGALVLVFTQDGSSYSLTLGRASAAVAASRIDLLTPVVPPLPGAVPPAPVAVPPVPPVFEVVSPVGPDVAPSTVPVEAPVTSRPLLPAALSVGLAGGPTSVLVLAVLALVGLVGCMLPRLPGLLLTVPGTTDCEEQKA